MRRITKNRGVRESVLPKQQKSAKIGNEGVCKMFEVGDYLIYGLNGVCRVEAVGTMEMSGMPKDRLYYTLIPVYQSGCRLFTPVDNVKTVIRPLVSREEALAYIDRMPEAETIWIPDEKRRETLYKEVVRKCDPAEWIRIIKTLFLRKKARIQAGKKVTFGDEKYLRIAEENLYGEFAMALDMTKEETEKYVIERVKSAEEKGAVTASE